MRTNYNFSWRRAGGIQTSILSITPPSSGTYYTGNTLTFTVLFSDIVTVTGTPYIDLTFTTYGNTNARALYVSGTGTNTLTFNYTVQNFDFSEGIAAVSPIVLNGGTISGSLNFTPPNMTGVIIYAYPTVNWSNYDTTDDKAAVTFTSQVLTVNNDYIKMVTIDERRFLLVYSDTASDISARIGSLDSSGNITFGAEQVIISSITVSSLSLALLDSTHAIVGYEESSTCKAVVFTFSGVTVGTVGTPITVEAIDVQHDAIVGMSATEAMIAYRDVVNGDGRITYLTISGTTITKQNTLLYATQDVNDIEVRALSSTRVLLVTAHTGGVEIEGKLLNVVANTPNVLSTLTILNDAITADTIGIGVVNSTKAIVSYTDSFNNITYAIAVTATADVLAKGTRVTIRNAVTNEMSIAIPDSTHAVISMNRYNTDYATIVIGISGTTLTAGTLYTTATPSYGATNTAVVQPYIPFAFMDQSDSQKGKVIVLSSEVV